MTRIFRTLATSFAFMAVAACGSSLNTTPVDGFYIKIPAAKRSAFISRLEEYAAKERFRIGYNPDRKSPTLLFELGRGDMEIIGSNFIQPDEFEVHLYTTKGGPPASAAKLQGTWRKFRDLAVETSGSNPEPVKR